MWIRSRRPTESKIAGSPIGPGDNLWEVVEMLRAAVFGGVPETADRGLCSRVSALEADVLAGQTPAEPAPPARETAWVVKTMHAGIAFGVARDPEDFLWNARLGGSEVAQILRFPSRSDAETLARLLGIGEPALIYTDTMEEVG